MTKRSDEPDAGIIGILGPAVPEAWPFFEERQSLADVVNRVLDRGVVAHGDVTISVAGVDLVYLGLSALLTSVATAKERVHASGVATPDAERVRAPALPPAGRSAAAIRAAAAAPSAAAPPQAPESPSEPTSPRGDDPFAAKLVDLTQGLPDRLQIDPDSVQRDLARLVLTLVELLRRIVEHQAVRRMDDPDLTEEQVERMGNALRALEEKLQEIKAAFGLADDQLNIDLGPLGNLL